MRTYPNENAETAPVAGVVLAAGDSSRMGTNKLLLELGDEPILRRVTRCALDAGLSPVIAVLGFETDRARGVLSGLAVDVITNPDYKQGMNSSVSLGISQVPAEGSAAVVILGDMPLVTPDMIANLVEQYRVHRPPLVVSRFGEVRAPPTLYDRSVFPEFGTARGDGCGRRIVRKYSNRAITVDFPAAALADVDAPADYERMKQALGD